MSPTKPDGPAGNIYLIGFSGVGKTQSGRRVAEMLGWTFCEMDDEIERRVGMPISQIFSERGEEFFREIESQVLESAVTETRSVVSTGGGTPVSEANRDIMARTGVVIRLTASPTTIHARLTASYGRRDRALRPMLGDDVSAERIASLLAEREPAYATADRTIDTEGRSHDDVAAEIVSTWREVPARTGNPDE